jgi:hypothetical protein
MGEERFILMGVSRQSNLLIVCHCERGLNTIRIDEETISYFKNMADSKGIPYQSLINLYLRDCASEHRQLETKWG